MGRAQRLEQRELADPLRDRHRHAHEEADRREHQRRQRAEPEDADDPEPERVAGEVGRHRRSVHDRRRLDGRRPQGRVDRRRLRRVDRQPPLVGIDDRAASPRACEAEREVVDEHERFRLVERREPVRLREDVEGDGDAEHRRVQLVPDRRTRLREERRPGDGRERRGVAGREVRERPQVVEELRDRDHRERDLRAGRWLERRAVAALVLCPVAAGRDLERAHGAAIDFGAGGERGDVDLALAHPVGHAGDRQADVEADEMQRALERLAAWGRQRDVELRPVDADRARVRRELHDAAVAIDEERGGRQTLVAIGDRLESLDGREVRVRADDQALRPVRQGDPGDLRPARPHLLHGGDGRGTRGVLAQPDDVGHRGAVEGDEVAAADRRTDIDRGVRDRGRGGHAGDRLERAVQRPGRHVAGGAGLDPHVGPGGPGRLIGLALGPRRGVRRCERPERGGEDQEQRRPGIAQRSSGDLPAAQRPDQSAGSRQRPLAQLGEPRHDPDREHRPRREPDRGRGHEQRVDAQRAACRARERRPVEAELEHRDHRHHDQREIQPEALRQRTSGLAAHRGAHAGDADARGERRDRERHERDEPAADGREVRGRTGQRRAQADALHGRVQADGLDEEHREPRRDDHGRHHHDQRLAERHRGEMPRPRATRAQQRGLRPAAFEQQRGDEDHRVRREHAELHHQQQDPGLRDEDGAVDRRQDRRQLGGDRGLVGARKSGVDAGQEAVHLGRDGVERLRPEPANVRDRPPLCVERLAQRPARQVRLVDDQRPARGELAALVRAVEVERVREPVPVRRVGPPGPGDRDVELARRVEAADERQVIASPDAEGGRRALGQRRLDRIVAGRRPLAVDELGVLVDALERGELRQVRDRGRIGRRVRVGRRMEHEGELAAGVRDGVLELRDDHAVGGRQALGQDLGADHDRAVGRGCGEERAL